MSHPAGVGLWRITLKDEVFPSEEVLERGHTAHEAWSRARGRLAEHVGFNDCLFELVADVAPPAEPQPSAGEEAA